jgi:hypothetical protein
VQDNDLQSSVLLDVAGGEAVMPTVTRPISVVAASAGKEGDRA